MILIFLNWLYALELTNAFKHSIFYSLSDMSKSRSPYSSFSIVHQFCLFSFVLSYFLSFQIMSYGEQVLYLQNCGNDILRAKIMLCSSRKNLSLLQTGTWGH